MKKSALKLLTYLGVAVILLHFLITFAIRVSFTLMPNTDVALFWLNTFGINDFFENIKFYQSNPTLPPLNQFYYIASFLLSLLATLIVGRGRNIVEILGIVVSFGIPQKRKTWGKIYNSANNKPLPFASIRVIQNDENGHFIKVIQEIVSDVEGNYRISALSSEKDVIMQVRLSGFATIETKLENIKERTNTNDIIQDIYLNSEDNIYGENINRKQDFIRKVYKGIVIALYILSLSSVITIAFVAFRFELTMPALKYNLAVAIITLVWNTYVLFNFGQSEAGIILDKETNKPVPLATIKVYKDNKQIFSKILDKSGKIILSLHGGDYKADIFKEGYFPIKDFELKLNRNGYTKNNIYLEKDKSNISTENSGKLANPFV